MTPDPVLAAALREWESRLYAAKHGEATTVDLYVEWWETFRPRIEAAIARSARHPESVPDETTHDPHSRDWFEGYAAAIARSDRPEGELRAAAQAVLDTAEPDDDFEGAYVQFLVGALEFERLRAALHSKETGS